MNRIALLPFVAGFSIVSLGFIDEAWSQDTGQRPYLYVSLDEAVSDESEFFWPSSVTDTRRVFGTLSVCEGDVCSASVAVFRRGEITPLQDGFAAIANNRGKVGGGVDLDLALGTFQAALFSHGQTKLIPPLTDEFASLVIRLSNSNIAFVESYDSASNTTYYLTRRGKIVPVDFGTTSARHIDLNDRGRISGTLSQEDGDRAFRYNPASGRLTVLEPLPTEPDAWGQAINSRGDVLGYSFVFGGLERIGVWHGTEFETFFVEGTPEFPTISNNLLWNERGLIVITNANDLNTYLVPRPGVRLNLAELTEGPLPPWTVIFDINNRGDMIGMGGEERFNVSKVFLLRRVGPLPDQDGQADALAAPEPRPVAAAVHVRRVPVPEHPLHAGLYDPTSRRELFHSKSW